MIKLIEVSPNNWVFRHNLPEGAEDSFDNAVELYESGNLVEAEETLRELLFVCPHYIDALHHLALIFSEDELELESYLCWREAVRIGLEAIPSNFSWHTSHMNWWELGNRPFMRVYHALGLSFLNNQGPASAVEIFARLVSVNHNDNLGCRYLLMQCYLDLKEWQSALNLSLQYNTDTGPDIVFSKVIALLQLDQEDAAIDALTLAIKQYPTIAKELVKNKHSEPKSKHPGLITSGGEDEAYDYWQRNRIHWASSTMAYKILKGLLEK
ncbi:MAG TPA: CDC27 family protein [Methylobacter sp.]|jgi:tetratricopeptide (TPR) repeat protein